MVHNSYLSGMMIGMDEICFQSNVGLYFGIGIEEMVIKYCNKLCDTCIPDTDQCTLCAAGTLLFGMTCYETVATPTVTVADAVETDSDLVIELLFDVAVVLSQANA